MDLGILILCLVGSEKDGGNYQVSRVLSRGQIVSEKVTLNLYSVDLCTGTGKTFF